MSIDVLEEKLQDSLACSHMKYNANDRSLISFLWSTPFFLGNHICIMHLRQGLKMLDSSGL